MLWLKALRDFGSLRLRKFLKLTLFLVALSIIGLFTLVLPVPNILLWGGTQSAVIDLPNGLTVEIEMAPDLAFSSVDYERRLTVCRGTLFKCDSEWLILQSGGSGPHLRLYEDPNGGIVLVDQAFTMRVAEGPKVVHFNWQEELDLRLREEPWDCREEEPGPIAIVNPPPSRYFKDLKFLGTIGFLENPNEPDRGDPFRFLAFDAYPEIICGYPSRG